MKPYDEYTPEEIDAFRRGELEALGVWYTGNDFAETIRIVWSDSCEGFCSCLDSDYPREVVIADLTRAAHVAAFGAIRRAVGMVREYEEAAERSGDFAGRHTCRIGAAAIRRAIRAAMQGDQP